MRRTTMAIRARRQRVGLDRKREPARGVEHFKARPETGQLVLERIRRGYGEPVRGAPPAGAQRGRAARAKAAQGLSARSRPADRAIGRTTCAVEAWPRIPGKSYPDTENPRLGVTRMSLSFSASSSARPIACWQCTGPHEKPGS